MKNPKSFYEYSILEYIFNPIVKWWYKQTLITQIVLLIIGVHTGFLIGRLMGKFLWG
jgi:hypothetical protein